MFVLPLEQMLISQSTKPNRPRWYGLVYSSHGEPAHLCTAEECGVLTIGYEFTKLFGGRTVEIV